jgi:hypothetical protein
MASVKIFVGKLTIVFLMVVFLIPAAAFARIRCGNDIITKGDSSGRVMVKLRKCGELLEREIIEENTEATFSGRTKYKKNRSDSSGNFRSATEVSERWHVIIHKREGDIYWQLIFRGGNLIKFEDWERSD